jgi:hypothetical protein
LANATTRSVAKFLFAASWTAQRCLIQHAIAALLAIEQWALSQMLEPRYRLFHPLPANDLGDRSDHLDHYMGSAYGQT